MENVNPRRSGTRPGVQRPKIIFPLAVDRPGNPISMIHHHLAKELAPHLEILAFRQQKHTELPGVTLKTVVSNKYLQALQILWWCYVENSVDVVHLTPNAALLPLLAKRCKKVVTIHESPVLTNKNTWLVRKALYRMYRSADTRVAVSTYVQKTLLDSLKLSSTVIYNAITPPKIKKRAKQNNTSKHCIFVGSFTWNKHPERIVAVAQNLKEHEFIMIGDGPLKKKLLQELEHTPNIQHKSFVQHDELLAMIAASDALLQPTESEGFGLVLLEAMAVETPIIAFRSGASPEIITKETGILVNSMKEFEQAVQNFKKSTFTPSALRKRAQTFNWKRAAKQYLEVYHES